MDKIPEFPHYTKEGHLHPVARFPIGERWLCCYYQKGTEPPEYTLAWSNHISLYETNMMPNIAFRRIQSAMEGYLIQCEQQEERQKRQS